MRTKILNIFFMFVMVFVISGCALDIEQHNMLLSTSDVREALKKAGIHLVKCYRIDPEDFVLNGVTPSVWEVGRKRDDHVFIYVFDNFKDRRIATVECYADKFELSLKPFLREDYDPMSYEAKNVLVIYTSKYDLYYPKSDLSRELYLVGFVMNNLKEIKQTIFTGESEHWKGTIILKEYEHILTKDGRILNHDEWVRAGRLEKLDREFEYRIRPRLTYKKADITNINEVCYHIVKPRGSGSCSGSYHLYNRFRTADYGEYGGGRRATEDDIYVMTVRWNGNEEVMELRAK